MGELMYLKARRLSKDKQYYIYENDLKLDSSEVAVIISDMWDTHWCRQPKESATTRVAELAVPINALLKSLRANFKDICIIHCPSNIREKAYGPHAASRTSGEESAYDNMQKFLKKKQDADFPKSVPELTIRKTIDPQGIECDCSVYPDKKCQSIYKGAKEIWTRQNKAIEIEKSDYIASIDEIDKEHTYVKDSVISFMQNRATPIKYAIMVGVHTNFCILTRSFGMKKLLGAGIFPILLRDLTDGMIPREQPPFKDHFSALEDVFDFIENYRTTDGSVYCRTALSTDIRRGTASPTDTQKSVERPIINGERFRFKSDYRLCRNSDMPSPNTSKESIYFRDGRDKYQLNKCPLPSALIFQNNRGKIFNLDFDYDEKAWERAITHYSFETLEFGEYFTSAKVFLRKSYRFDEYYIQQVIFKSTLKEHIVGHLTEYYDPDDKECSEYDIKAKDGYAFTYMQCNYLKISSETRALNYIQFYSQQVQMFRIIQGDKEEKTHIIKYLSHSREKCRLIFFSGRYVCQRSNGQVVAMDKIEYINEHDEKESATIVSMQFKIQIGDTNELRSEIKCMNHENKMQTISRYFEEEKEAANE